MAEIAKIDNIYIPNVTSQELTYEKMIDESRTASGKLKRDVACVKRRWQLTASKITTFEKDAILNLLRDKNYGVVLFWLDSFGDETDAIPAYVDVESVQRHPFGKNGTWYPDGADIELIVVEQ